MIDEQTIIDKVNAVKAEYNLTDEQYNGLLNAVKEMAKTLNYSNVAIKRHESGTFVIYNPDNTQNAP